MSIKDPILTNVKYDDKSNAMVLGRSLMDLLVNIDSQYRRDIKNLLNLRKYVKLDSYGRFDIRTKGAKVHVATCLGIHINSFYDIFRRLTLKGFLLKWQKGIYSYNPEYIIFEERGDMVPYTVDLPSRRLDKVKVEQERNIAIRAKVRKRRVTSMNLLQQQVQQLK